MTTIERVTLALTTTVSLTGGLFLRSATGITQDVTFRFPGTTGNTGDYIKAIGGGSTIWSPLNSTFPTPANDIYHALTNELITINVLSGVSGNTGGTDMTAGTAIQSVTILTAPKYGTLSATGPTGGYSYRSFPRYTGQDQFYYAIRDANGLTSQNSAVCNISIDSGPTAGYTGATFLYSCTGSTNVILYSNGTESTFFTATFPGIAGTPPGVGSLATNREDNLIYYTAFGYTQGLLFSYDYANNTQQFIGNMTGGVDFSGQGGFLYNMSYLHYMQSSSSTAAFYGTVMGPYAPGTTQAVIFAQSGTIAGTAARVSLTWDYQENNFIACGTGGVLYIMNPFTPSILLGSSKSYTGATNIAIAACFDGLHYAVPIGTTGVYNLDFVPGTLTGTYPSISRNDVNSLAEWVNVRVSS